MDDPKTVALAIVGIFPAVAVLVAVFAQSKTIAALAQLGGLQGREAAQEEYEKLPKTRESAISTAEKAIRRQDRLSYTLGVFNTMVTAWLLGSAPQYFYLWHTPKCLLLVSLRWHTFRKDGKHYLLYDFCYWANLLCLVYLWGWPTSATLFQVLFLVCNGPLAWSVLAFAQSLVFHSHAHMTSVFVHVSPMMLTYAIRWRHGPTADREVFSGRSFAVCDGGCDAEPPLRLLGNALAYFYAPWIVLYYLWVFVILGERIKRKSYQTLYDRVTTSGPAAKALGAVFQATGAHSDLFKKAMYMSVHLAFGTATMALALLQWYSFVANTFFVLAIALASVWNASGYYFNHFTRKYEEGLSSQVAKVVAPDPAKTAPAPAPAPAPALSKGKLSLW